MAEETKEKSEKDGKEEVSEDEDNKTFEEELREYQRQLEERQKLFEQQEAEYASKLSKRARRVAPQPGLLQTKTLVNLFLHNIHVDVESLKRLFDGPPPNNENDPPYWRRPTPVPKADFSTNAEQIWPKTSIPCGDGLPSLRDLSLDFRTTCIGIGSAYGTGKTNFALTAVETTIAREKNTQVIYAAFANGWHDELIHETLKDPVKYLGLWLFAAKHSTRINPTNGQVECCSGLFKAICRAYLTDISGLSLPDDLVLIKASTLIIFDEVQAFSFPGLDKLLCQLITKDHRLSLIVGAFNAQFSFPSGMRMIAAPFRPLSDANVQELFASEKVKIDYKMVNLPKLLKGCIRPFTAIPLKTDIWRGEHPIEFLYGAYKEIYERNQVPGVLFRAAISNQECSVDLIRKVYSQKTSALGAVVIISTGDDRCRVIISPFQVQCNVEYIDADRSAQIFIKDTVRGFVFPTWKEFEDLTGAGPALRIAALSHASEMQWDITAPLHHVFKSEACTKQAADILQYHVKPNLTVRRVNAGSTFSYQYPVHSFFDEQCVTVITGHRDHQAPIDNVIIVPVKQYISDKVWTFLIIAIDGKHTEEPGKTANVQFAEDIKPKLQHMDEFEAVWATRKAKIREPWMSMLVIATSRGKSTVTDKQVKAHPGALIVSNDLSSLFGACLVPAMFSQ